MELCNAFRQVSPSWVVGEISSITRLTFALSGAPPRTQAKRALLIGASALERVVRPVLEPRPLRARVPESDVEVS